MLAAVAVAHSEAARLHLDCHSTSLCQVPRLSHPPVLPFTSDSARPISDRSGSLGARCSVAALPEPAPVGYPSLISVPVPELVTAASAVTESGLEPVPESITVPVLDLALTVAPEASMIIIRLS